MTPDHHRWHEFIELLAGPDYCDFKLADPENLKSLTWKCIKKSDRPFSREILARFGGIDIETTMEYFAQHGGHCDCEVFFNVDK